jgi:hypothetical protein
VRRVLRSTGCQPIVLGVELEGWGLEKTVGARRGLVFESSGALAPVVNFSQLTWGDQTPDREAVEAWCGSQ